MVELRWDEIGAEYSVLKDRVIGWVNTKVEKIGAVPMDLDGLEEEGREDREADCWSCGVCDNGSGIGAVYPNMRC